MFAMLIQMQTWHQCWSAAISQNVRIHQGQLPPAGGLLRFTEGGISGSCQGGASKIHRIKADYSFIP